MTRSFEIVGRENFGAGGVLADWELELPRIETLTANQNGITDWQVGMRGNVNRCSQFAKPPSVPPPVGDSLRATWEPETWWHGYQLIVPGHGKQDLLKNLGAPGTTPTAYPIVTKARWRISCLATTANGQPGEAFLAEAPDGTRYWFNHLSYRGAPDIKRPLGSGPLSVNDTPQAANDDFLKRRRAVMSVTRVEDRFGNALAYGYNPQGQLATITASDGRALRLEYNTATSLLERAVLMPDSAQRKTWTYAYVMSTNANRTRLAAVTRPDGSRWQFDFDPLVNQASLYADGGNCLEVAARDGTWVGRITHPGGASGAFTIRPLRRGRSNVPREYLLQGMEGPYRTGSYATYAKEWYGYALVERRISGAGLPERVWTYRYSAPNGSWSDDCRSSCVGTVWTSIRNPDGTSRTYTFSNRFDHTESQLLRVDDYQGDGVNRIQSTVNTYAAPTGQPWPQYAGVNLQARINAAQTERLSPLLERTTTRGSDAFTWRVTAFNNLAQPTTLVRGNNLGQPQLTTHETWRNDTTTWVLGLAEKSVNAATGEILSQSIYNTNSTLRERWAFGRKVMGYTWNAAGELTGFTDALGRTTSLASYKRGVPQSIGFADGSSIQHVVDDLGQITSTTDEEGARTTYQYDAGGRVQRIIWPDDVVNGSTWSHRTLQHEYVATAERGIAAGHWRTTIAEGQARTVLWYDALMQPILSDTWDSANASSHVSRRTDYDHAGRTTFTSIAVAGSPALGAIATGTRQEYDALGRSTRVLQDSELGVLTTTHQYLAGHQLRTTNPRGYATTTAFQALDEPSYDAPIRVTSPSGLTTTITRDVYGKITTLERAGITRRYDYDAYQRLCAEYQPETGTTRMGYDAADNLLWSAAGLAGGQRCTDAPPPERVVRVHDARNRVVSLRFPDGEGDQTLAYTADGLVRSIDTRNAGRVVCTTYAYNARRLLRSETTELDAAGTPHDRIFGNGFDAEAGVAERYRIDYAYDANGHVHTESGPDGTVNRRPVSRLAMRSRHQGIDAPGCRAGTRLKTCGATGLTSRAPRIKSLVARLRRHDDVESEPAAVAFKHHNPQSTIPNPQSPIPALKHPAHGGSGPRIARQRAWCGRARDARRRDGRGWRRSSSASECGRSG